MNPESERIEELFRLFVDGSITESQQIELEGYLHKYPELHTLYAKLCDEDSFLISEWAGFTKFGNNEANEAPIRNTYFSFPFMRVVASLVLVSAVFAAIWLYSHPMMNASSLTRKERYKNDVDAGSSKAVATFANGNLLFLGDTSAMYGQRIPDSSGVEFLDGQIKYLPKKGDEHNGPGFNAVATPQGGQYRVVLPDGSSAKLNAASSIRFPTRFDREQRVVEIHGEVYFDIVSDKARPFIVMLPNQAQIEVLGTSFNVKAYPDDPVIKTTLDHGNVRLKAGGDELLMKSGEQVQLAARALNPVILKQKVDADVETSWKDGYFNFENVELKTIMKDVARWYDVDIEYKTQITEQFNILMLPRSLSISKLLELLELTGHVKFIIDGRRITVMT